jgi:hypothetical protein
VRQCGDQKSGLSRARVVALRGATWGIGSVATRNQGCRARNSTSAGATWGIGSVATRNQGCRASLRRCAALGSDVERSCMQPEGLLPRSPTSQASPGPPQRMDTPQSCEPVAMENADTKTREDRVRRALSKVGHRLCKTPARSWQRAHYPPGYMVVNGNNTAIAGANARLRPPWNTSSGSSSNIYCPSSRRAIPHRQASGSASNSATNSAAVFISRPSSASRPALRRSRR